MATGTVTLDRESVRNSDVDPQANIARSKLAKNNDVVEIPLTSFRIWDSFAELPTTAAGDDLAFSGGDVTSADAPCLTTGDVKATTSTRYAIADVLIPSRYVSEDPITLVILAGAETTVADTTMNVDAEVYADDGDGTTGTDICATAAQDMNNTTADTFSFTVTPTSRAGGDKLFIRVAIDYVDSGTGTAVIGNIYRAYLTLNGRG